MKTIYKTLIGIIIVLVIIRLILPFIVLHYANKTLANIKGYYGHVEDIGLSLYRGAFALNNIYLNKSDSVSNTQTKFFESEAIDLSVEWSALLHGSIVGKIIFKSPKLFFTKDKVEIDDVKKDSSSFKLLLKKFMPLKVNRFEIIGGTVHYVDNTSKPKVDISLKQLHILATNLTNVIDKKNELPSSVVAEAQVYEGTMSFSMKMNALADNPTFDINAEINNINMVLLNDFFKAYGNFTISKGEFNLYTEMAAKDGKFIGYVKPLIKGLKVLGPEDKNQSIFQKIWESMVGTAASIFKNHKKDQLATKIPIEGKFKSPKTKTLYAIWEVLRNAFIQALMPNIDYEININSTNKVDTGKKKTFLNQVFSSSKDKKVKKDKAQ